jgi:hypothetical protein
MKDAGGWVIGFIILMALFNKDCNCVKHLGYYLNQNTQDLSVRR